MLSSAQPTITDELAKKFIELEGEIFKAKSENIELFGDGFTSGVLEAHKNDEIFKKYPNYKALFYQFREMPKKEKKKYFPSKEKVINEETLLTDAAHRKKRGFCSIL